MYGVTHSWVLSGLNRGYGQTPRKGHMPSYCIHAKDWFTSVDLKEACFHRYLTRTQARMCLDCSFQALISNILMKCLTFPVVWPYSPKISRSFSSLMASGLSILLPRIKMGTFPMVSSVISACYSLTHTHIHTHTHTHTHTHRDTYTQTHTHTHTHTHRESLR